MSTIAAFRDTQPLPQDLTSVYFAKMSRVALLTAAEEVALAKAIEAGRAAERLLAEGDAPPDAAAAVRRGARATERFVSANLRLVVRMAADLAGRTAVPLDDLVQDGTIGLIQAVERFDWRRGYRFSTYASWWIRRELQHGLGEQSRTIRLPFALHAAVARVRAATARLESETGRRPTLEELSAATNLSVKQVEAAGDAERDVVSFDASRTDLRAFADAIPAADDVAHEVVEGAHRRTVLEQARTRLDARSWRVVARRVGLVGPEPASFETIGAELGMSRETARLIYNAAILDLQSEPALGTA